MLAGLPIRPGIAAASLPLFGETCWDVTPAVFRENARRCHCSVDFGLLANPAQRLTAKEYLYARLREPEGSLRPRLAPGSIRAVFNRLRRFMSFAEERSGVFDLGLLQQADLDAWLAHLQTGGARASHQIAALLDVPIDLHEHADRLSQPRVSVHALARAAGVSDRRLPAIRAREQHAAHPGAGDRSHAVLVSPVYRRVRARYFRRPDRIDQLRARARKIDVHRARGASPVVVVVARRLDEYLRDRRASGRGIPSLAR